MPNQLSQFARHYSQKVVCLMLTTAVAITSFAQSSGGEMVALTIGQQLLRVPTPVGFVETSRRNTELWDTALSFSAGDARIVAHFVLKSDLTKYESGADTVFKNFLLVQTPKRAEGLVATQAQFERLRAGTIAMQAQLASQLEPRLAAEIDRVSKAFSSNQAAEIQVKIDQIVPVSIDKDQPRTLLFTWLARGSVTENKSTKSQTMVVSAAYCFVNGKELMLIAYRHFSTPKDLHEARQQVDLWSNALLASN